MPNPKGRKGAKMIEPSKSRLRDTIDDLHYAVYFAEGSRVILESKLKRIRAILDEPVDASPPDPIRSWTVIKQAQTRASKARSRIAKRK